jgi:glucose/arabinose dehydrogenase/cytochrome c2
MLGALDVTPAGDIVGFEIFFPMNHPPLRFFSGIVAFGWAVSATEAAEAPGDADRGRTLFLQSCGLCHAAGPGIPGGQGPALFGVMGRKAASTPGFVYTKALTDSGLTWNAATLDRYLANPTATVPGTSMAVQVASADDRRDLVAFLATVRTPPPAAGGRRGPAVDPNATDPYDWRHQSPGTSRLISADKLPAPYSTSAPSNFPQVVPPPADAKLSVPPGFKVELFAKGLENGRIVHVAPNGDIFIAETRANRIRLLRAADGATTPTVDEIFATGLDRPFGIAFFPSGPEPQWIYVANNNSVVRFPYHNGDLKTSGPKETIVPKLAETTNGHTTRDIAFSKDGKRLFISVGSGSNVAENISTKAPDEIKQWETANALGAAWGSEAHRANVLVTSPDGREPIRIFATGIRNPVGLAIEPVTGDLWTSTNERDGLGDDLVPDYVTRVKEGSYYGWPWYYMGNHEDPRLKGARPDLAGKATVPDVLLQAHSAALGIAFYTAEAGSSVFPAPYRGQLFVALHGSWNRNSRTGYKVVRVKLQNGKPTGEYEDFLTGFVASGGSVWGRPVGVAVAHDGALLITEDGNNTIWRVSTTR